MDGIILLPFFKQHHTFFKAASRHNTGKFFALLRTQFKASGDCWMTLALIMKFGLWLDMMLLLCCCGTSKVMHRAVLQFDNSQTSNFYAT
ncbi:MAG: hypothetical protein HZT40_09595 [Candidatus Thiothrix singaporensis]|uniref:Uncharacterized protein n=1 Tax=Candidatus Thiothrix singaporensis TaxID=2799669 RepID=A0A7L6ART4_9GAMM|nr:MAG: hypothetical protein HZT40_09595 [Candidatus Thiothrix singaporensis]